MPSIGPEATFLSNDVLFKGLLEDFPYRIQLAPVFPFFPVAGHALRYATTGPLVPGTAIGPCDPIVEDAKRPNDANRVYRFAEIATQFRVCYKAQDVFSSNGNDQVAMQMALALRELLYKFWILFERGDASSNADEFDGLHRIVHPANVIDLQGRELRTFDLHRAREAVRANDGRDVVIFTSPVGKIAISEALYARGSHPPESDPIHFDGAQVYVNDLNEVFEQKAQKNGRLVAYDSLHDRNWHDLTTNIWFFVMGQGSLHGIMPAAAQSVIVRSTILPDGSTLVYHLTWPTAIACGTSGSLAVVKNARIPKA